MAGDRPSAGDLGESRAAGHEHGFSGGVADLVPPLAYRKATPHPVHRGLAHKGPGGRFARVWLICSARAYYKAKPLQEADGSWPPPRLSAVHGRRQMRIAARAAKR